MGERKRLTEAERDAICDVISGKPRTADLNMDELYGVVEEIVARHA